MTDYRSRSLWLEQQPDSLDPRASLDGDTQVDVAIVGGGYTGLWVAYYLLVADPSLRVLVIERDIVGFGASGRNGGWVTAELVGGYDAAKAARDHESAIRLMHAGIDAVDEIGRVAVFEGIDCHFHKGGTVRVARNQPQLERQRADVARRHQLGFADTDVRLLDAQEASANVNATDVLGGVFFSACARVQPANLARGLAEAVERRGGRIVEGTAACSIEAGSVRTNSGSVSAEIVIRATEGYTAQLGGGARRLAPLFSLMVATEPLPATTWNELGLRNMQTFADERHAVIYGQRTHDGRIAFGGNGTRYGYGSKIDEAMEQDAALHGEIIDTLTEMFPVLRGVEFTHRWGGPLGEPRDGYASVGLDRKSGIGWAGGHSGKGLAASNLQGRTLADLITEQATDITTLPWVNRQFRDWEPEPFRSATINSRLSARKRADKQEARTAKPAKTPRLSYRRSSI